MSFAFSSALSIHTTLSFSSATATTAFSFPSSSSSSTTTTTTTSTTTTTTSSSSSSTSTSTSFLATTTSSSISSTASATSVSPVVEQPSSSVTPTASVTDAGALSPASVSSLVLSSTLSTPSPTTTHYSSSGFFSDTGAVAGTFTVVGLVGIAAVIALIFFIAKRRARTYEEDTEFLDKSPDLSPDPPMTQVTSLDDMSSSDHAHYGAPPMTLASRPPMYYPDHPYSLHPQAFQAESLSQPHRYPGYTQHYPAQHIYSPEDYDIGYPPVASHGDPNMPNHNNFTHLQLESAPPPQAQAAFSNPPRPSPKSTLTVPAQRADSRFSVDSFYTGIAADSPTSGHAL